MNKALEDFEKWADDKWGKKEAPIKEEISEEKEIIEEEYADHITEEQKDVLRQIPF